MRRHLLSIALGTLASVAAPAFAQGGPDYTYTTKDSDRTLADYSQCVIGSRSGELQAVRFVRQVPGSPQATTAGTKLVYPDCLNSAFGTLTMRVNPVTLRPALFAALYRKRFGKTAPLSFEDAPPFALETLFDGATNTLPKANIAMIVLGACVVRADTPAAHSLLMAHPWTAAEDAALPAVTQATRGCLTTAQTVRLNRATIRGFVAEALYDFSSARAGDAAPGTQSAVEGRR